MAQPEETTFESFPAFWEPDAISRQVKIAVQHHRDEYELERQSERSIIGGPDGLQVQITEGDRVEIRPIQEFPKLNMLTMAENYARNPLIEPDIERFWEATIADTANFGSLHTRMTEDIALKIFMLEKIEEIFIGTNRRFVGNLDKFRINFLEDMPAGFDKMPFVIPEPANATVSSSIVKTPGAPKRKVTGPVIDDSSVPEIIKLEVPRSHHSKNRFLVPTAVLSVAAVGLAACGVLNSGSDDQSFRSETLPSMITLASTTSTIEPTTTTTTLEDCGDTIMVEPGQNLTEIANKCRVTLGELSMWNNLPNIDDIDAGQIIIVSAPPPTSSSLPASTTTLAPVSETTIATTTSPPPAPTTVKIEPLNNKDNPKDCAAIGGVEKIAPAGMTGISHIKSFGLTEEQVIDLVYRKGILKDFGLEIIIAETKECFIASREVIKSRYGV